MEFTRKEQFDVYVDLILAVRQEGTTKAAEEAERRKIAQAEVLDREFSWESIRDTTRKKF